MKNTLLLLLLIPIVSFGQVQQQATQVYTTSVNKTINQREYADALPKALEETKPNSMNYDDIQGFVLVSLSASNKKEEKLLKKT